MKKIIYTIGILMFVSALSSFTPKVLGAESESDIASLSACLIFSPLELLEEGADLADKAFPDFFNVKEEDVGQNLYLKIYDMNVNEPERKSFKNMAGKYGVTEAEMNQIVTGNFEPILARKKSLQMDEALEKMRDIQKQFLEEKDLLTLHAEIDIATQPNEMFANGDLEDSGFDLINDLNLIEEILFLKADPISVGQDFSEDAGIDNVDSSGQGAADNASYATTSKDEDSNKNNENGIPENDKPEEKINFNPNICFANSALNGALNKFDDQKEKEDKAEKPKQEDEYKGKSGEVLPAKPDEIKDVQPAPAGDWQKDLPCNDVFCLSVNFIKEPVSLYQNPDNCIACHIEKINEKLRETNSHNLIPGKATGNLLESNMCKKAAANVLGDIAGGFNFYAVAQPVSTPINDDIMNSADIQQSWRRFVESYKPFPFYELDPPDSEKAEFPPNEIDIAAKSAITFAGPQATFEEVNKETEAELAAKKKERARKQQVADTALKSDNDNLLFQAIKQEVEQMNYYFDTFQNIVRSLHEEVDSVTGSQACVKLKEKKSCP